MNRVFLPIIYLAIAIGLFYGLTRDLITKVEARRAEKAELVAALNRAQELRQVADRLRTEYYSFSDEERGRLNKMIPDNVDNVRLIIDTNNIAARYGMTIKDAKIKTEEKAPTDTTTNPSAKIIDNPSGQIGQGTVTIAFTVTGTYPVFRQFLGDLASSLRLVDIKKLSFKSADKDTYQYSVELNTYWLK
jgi:Tfp pilus assembly protein PilO